MIDVVVADDQGLFRIGMVEILAVADDVRVVGQAGCPAQLLSTLKQAKPRVLILSTRFVPALQQFQRVLERRKTALLVLAEENDQSAYMDWLRAHGIVYRSINEPALVDAVRRVARGELFVQQSISDGREDTSEVA